MKTKAEIMKETEDRVTGFNVVAVVFALLVLLGFLGCSPNGRGLAWLIVGIVPASILGYLVRYIFLAYIYARAAYEMMINDKPDTDDKPEPEPESE